MCLSKWSWYAYWTTKQNKTTGQQTEDAWLFLLLLSLNFLRKAGPLCPSVHVSPVFLSRCQAAHRASTFSPPALAPCSLISVSNTQEKEPSARSPFLYWPLLANHFPHGFVWDTQTSQLIMLINAIPLSLRSPLLSTQATTEICPASPLHRYQPLPWPVTHDFPNPRTNWSSPYWIFLLHSIGWLLLPWQTLLKASGSLFLSCLSLSFLKAGSLF